MQHNDMRQINKGLHQYKIEAQMSNLLLFKQKGAAQSESRRGNFTKRLIQNIMHPKSTV